MSGTVSLTYDDGPDPIWTERLLALLRRAGARATFFVMTPRAVVNSELIATMLDEGHEVGFHCYRHVRHSEQTEGELASELATGLRQLRSIGVEPGAWRVPWGVETDLTRQLAAEAGLRLWGWNVDSHDWRRDSAEQMLSAVGAQGGLRAGDVVLMHDGLGPGALRSGCEETLRLTGALLEAADARGLRPVPVSECNEVLA